MDITQFLIGKVPKDSHATQLKQIAGSKHVVSASVDNQGNGELKIRLGGDVTADSIKYSFKRLGYDVKQAPRVVELKL